ncbi:diaminobutyrate acetyltransferase [Vibrio sp. YMD68]|uniref:diaminobutyrate acetyltransferase n=1 Tax=Vibrio sp. YMD68 TaxID=3042300 RepID=UPI00249CAB67|nr:diaminobutyrate acetyltransferase [Vibrio sp. YMD68]WGV98656.1 diaminobutyrate acetyltransferase [Vibrio sp. YMD68]
MIASALWAAYPEIKKNTSKKWSFSEPSVEDGSDVSHLIAACPPLDVNSSYCHFLQSMHFSQTCVLARYDGDIAGFVSAYRKPDEPSTLFVWQVAVAPRFRGKGLASSMLDELLSRDHLSSINSVETTITEKNDASWAVFQKLDKSNGERGEVSTFLEKKTHFKGKQDTEYLYQIPLIELQPKGR